MAVQTMWMRENMFGFVGQPHERRFTEAELRVQRSLQKLSIPSWFINKSTPPRIIKDFVPIECRRSAWKNSSPYKYSDCNKVSDVTEPPKTSNDSHDFSYNSNDTYDIIKDVQDSVEKPKEEAILIKEELNTEIPPVKLKKVSETYPRVSPSRKIQNINIVFSRNSKFDYVKLSKEFLESTDPLENTRYSPNKQQNPEEETTKIKKKSYDQIKSSEPLKEKKTASLDTKDSFKVRSFSTPNGSPVSLFSSTLMDEELLNSSRPSSSCGSENVQMNCVNRKEKKIYPVDVNMMKQNLQTLKYLLSQREELLRCKKAITSQRTPKNNLTMTLSSICSSEDNYRSDSDRSESGCDKLINSQRKSTELEKIVKNSWSNRVGKVRALVDELNRQQKLLSPKVVRQPPDLNKTFVKMAVDALEDGNITKARQILFEKGRIKDDVNEVESASDSDLKSATSSMSFSLRDSDSSSDLEMMSPMLRNNHEKRFSYDAKDIHRITSNESSIKQNKEVYWITLPFCTMCPTSWGKTYTKTRTPSKKLFSIDETAVTDSGYSEVYDTCGPILIN